MIFISVFTSEYFDKAIDILPVELHLPKVIATIVFRLETFIQVSNIFSIITVALAQDWMSDLQKVIQV